MKKKYFKDNRLTVIPKKEKNKLEVFSYCASFFEEDKEYSEVEINEVIMAFYDDYSIIRRYLVDYHFLERDKYGKVYKKTAKSS
nr:DUF2087 domain-containing protein [Vagococcus hydrophili]